MAVAIEDYTIIEVRKPNVGENKPADVTADIVIDTSRKSWHVLHSLHIIICCPHHVRIFTGFSSHVPCAKAA